MAIAPRKARRWALNTLDLNRLEAMILASEWEKDPVSKEISAEAAVQKFWAVLEEESGSDHTRVVR